MCNLLPFVVVEIEILNDIFSLRQANPCNIGIRLQFIIPNVKTANHGFESLTYLGPKIWETITFKRNIFFKKL